MVREGRYEGLPSLCGQSVASGGPVRAWLPFSLWVPSASLASGGGGGQRWPVGEGPPPRWGRKWGAPFGQRVAPGGVWPVAKGSPPQRGAYRAVGGQSGGVAPFGHVAAPPLWAWPKLASGVLALWPERGPPPVGPVCSPLPV